MRTSLLLVGVVVVVGAIQVEASQSPVAAQRGVGHVARSADSLDVEGRLTFANWEIAIIREHYASRFSALPPGLQKKLVRTGQLPPGWQRKMEGFDVALERQLRSLPDGYARGVFEGHAVIYVPGTSIIIDVTALF